MEHEQIVNSVASLHKILDSFMLRRIKADVLHDVMVPKKEIDVYCGLSETQKKLYYDIIQARLNKNKKKDDKLIIVSNELILQIDICGRLFNLKHNICIVKECGQKFLQFVYCISRSNRRKEREVA